MLGLNTVRVCSDIVCADMPESLSLSVYVCEAHSHLTICYSPAGLTFLASSALSVSYLDLDGNTTGINLFLLVSYESDNEVCDNSGSSVTVESLTTSASDAATSQAAAVTTTTDSATTTAAVVGRKKRAAGTINLDQDLLLEILSDPTV